MTRNEYLKELEVFSNFKFFPDDHHYEVDGKKVGISVTRFIEQYCNEFNAKEIARYVAKKKKNKTVTEILNEWKYKNRFACEKGSTCHEFAQSLWSGDEYRKLTFDESKDFLNAVDKIQTQALNFKNDFDDKLEHLVDEFVVGSKEYDIASAIDHIFINKITGGLVLVDYKTNSNIYKRKKNVKKMKAPLRHLKDLTINHYYIQLSIYKYLVEKYTNLVFEDMFIVYFSENIKNYEIIEIPYLKKEVETILEWRKWE